MKMRLTVAIAAVGCLLAACTIPAPQAPQQPSTPTSAPPTSASPTPSESPTPSPSPAADCAIQLNEGGDTQVQKGDSGDFSAIQADVKKAERYVDGFWARHWEECFPQTQYRAPDKRGVYTDDDPEKCDGVAMESDNALYCPDGHFVAYGRKLLERAEDSDVGVGWAYFVVAHEWGHAVQQLLADGPYADLVPNPLDAKHELQADCLAGAALFGSNYEGFLDWQTKDSEQIGLDLLRLSDDTPWTRVTPQGDIRTGGPLPRIAALQTGLNADGVKTCLKTYA